MALLRPAAAFAGALVVFVFGELEAVNDWIHRRDRDAEFTHFQAVQRARLRGDGTDI